MSSRKIISVLALCLVFCLVVIVVLWNRDRFVEKKLVTPQQLGSYALGYRLVQEQKNQGVELDMDSVKFGIFEATKGKIRFSHSELVSFESRLKDLMSASAQSLAQENQKKALEFFAQNKNREGVSTTGSGLQYKVLQEGQGEKPQGADWIEISYEIKLLSGELYESSKPHGDFVQIPLSSAFPGMREALALMKPGAQWTVYVPPELGFGSIPRQGLAPNSVLILNLNLQKVLKK